MLCFFPLFSTVFSSKNKFFLANSHDFSTRSVRETPSFVLSELLIHYLRCFVSRPKNIREHKHSSYEKMDRNQIEGAPTGIIIEVTERAEGETNWRAQHQGVKKPLENL